MTFTPFVTLAAAVVGEAGIATDLIQTGSNLGQLGAAGILGIVALASIFALVKVYLRNQEQSDETIVLLKDTIEKNTTTLQSLRDNCFKNK